MAWVMAPVIANAIPTTCDVKFDSRDGNEITLITSAIAPKAKEAETLAVKQAFFALLDRGVEGVQSGQPILTTPNKEFNYTFYKEGKYINYLVANPLKLDETKIGDRKRVRVKVTINLEKLKKDVMAFKLPVSPAWQDSKQVVSATASLNPTIVVVPAVKSGFEDSFEGMKTMMEENPAMKHAVNAVSSCFADRGYKTRDFMTMLANSKTEDLLLDGTQTDVETMMIQQLPADIVVYVDLEVVQDGKKGQCTLTMNAVERQTAGKLSSATYGSGQYMTTDFISLTDYAVKKIENQFFTQLQGSFDRMVESGREVKLEFVLGETVSDWDFDTETPATEVDFKETLEEWLRSMANHGVYDMSQNNDKFIAATINIPLWDSERGRSYSISNFSLALKKFIREHLGDAYKVKVVSMGQKLIITIE